MKLSLIYRIKFRALGVTLTTLAGEERFDDDVRKAVWEGARLAAHNALSTRVGIPSEIVEAIAEEIAGNAAEKAVNRLGNMLKGRKVVDRSGVYAAFDAVA